MENILGKRNTCVDDNEVHEEHDEEDVDDPSEFKNINFDEVSDEYRQSKLKKTKVCEKSCFICDTTWRLDGEEAVDEHAIFFSMIQDNIRDISFDEIFKRMSVYFEYEIKEKSGDNTVDLTPEYIKNHFFYCIKEPLIEYYRQIDNYKTIRDMLLDSLIQANKNDERLYDYKIIEKIEKISAKIISLYKEKPAEALFASSRLNLQ